MATTIQPSIIDPLKVEDWQEWIKLHVLEYTRDGSSVLDCIRSLCGVQTSDEKFMRVRFGHNTTIEEVETAIKKAYADGLIEPSDYVCKCCKGKTFLPKEILDHVTAFRLTDEGRNIIPDNVPHEKLS